MRQPKSRIWLILSMTVLLLMFIFLSNRTFLTLDSMGWKHRGSWQQKDLVITYCCSPPPEEPYVKNVAAQNYNLLPIAEEALPFAEKYGVRVLLQHGLLSTKTLQSPRDLEQLDNLIERVKDHPAMDGYYIFDEPQEKDFPELSKLVKHIKARDPHHFCFVNLLPIFGVQAKKLKDPSLIYKDHINEYIRQFQPDLLSYDYYPFLKNAKSPMANLFFVHLRVMRECARRAHLPFMNIIQASDFLKNDWTMPTASQLRWQVYNTLAYGGRGVSYFLYWGSTSQGGMYQDGKKMPLVDAGAALNREMKALSSTLMYMDSLYVFHTAPIAPGGMGAPFGCPLQITSSGQYVVGVFGENKQERAFMIVNRDFEKPSLAKVKVVGAETISEFQRVDSGWKTIAPNQNGEFQIPLEAGDGKLFRF